MTALSTHRTPKVTVVTAPSKADVVVLGLARTDGDSVLLGADPMAKAARKKFGVDLRELATQLGAKPEVGTVVALPEVDTRILVAGLGSAELSPVDVRDGVAAAVRKASALADGTDLTVAVSLGLTDPELVEAAALGAALGSYEFAKVSPHERSGGVREVQVVTSTKEGRDAADRAAVIADAVLTVRDWVNAPANLLYPETFAAEAQAALKGAKGVSVKVLDDRELAAGGYGGLTAVGGGSSRGPRLVRMEYAPRGAKATLALVGKGITFDSGGLNLKPSEGMYTMKCDMSGAAAVIAAVKAISELGLPVKVIGYASMAENLPSGSAYRPSDVLTMYGGQTVENVNTDAEGRLVMADAIARASEDSPDLLVDVATLTGACMIALGDRVAGVMASDDEVAERVLDAAEVAGEDFWHLPIPEYLRKTLDSKVADMKSGGPRYGGALTAAAFLQRFVADGIDWAHLDIAGPAFNDDQPRGATSVGGTGFAVRTLVELAASLGR